MQLPCSSCSSSWQAVLLPLRMLRRAYGLYQTQQQPARCVTTLWCALSWVSACVAAPSTAAAAAWREGGTRAAAGAGAADDQRRGGAGRGCVCV
ncbi:hypothetical protein COO60DRAFT_58363 [Scenedesmus sp. NREL 46B-D3]|nr:hypothetical protein COO60DRAFT_58363 [Scenedesmus sp. NREL 46B-D3]